MKTLFILMSHIITSSQKEDARNTLGIEHFVVVPSKWWGQIPADAKSVCSYTEEIESYLEVHARAGDMLLVQGDFGATVRMVYFAQTIGLTTIYATTNRISKEVIEGEKIITVREFRHVRFRQYETVHSEENVSFNTL